RPSVKASKTYGNNWWKWWVSLQPEWRGRGNHLTKWNPQDDWAALKVPGKNGIASVLAALFWWAIAVDEKKVKHSVRLEWQSAAHDVRWAM
ncbi:hypothetical protein C8J56DRAFT_731395, partial [Mycena floridula]